MAFQIVILGLWAYPVVAFSLLWLTKKRSAMRRKIFLVSGFSAALTLLALLTHISTTSSILDWFMLSTLYLSWSLLLIWTAFQKKRLWKLLGVLAMLCSFSLGYISGTVGIVGVGLVIADYEVNSEKWLGDSLIYKETRVGNAISDYRATEVEIYRTISWIPILEWREQKKVYPNIVNYNNFDVDYRSKEDLVIISTTTYGKKAKLEHWTDTLKINHQR